MFQLLSFAYIYYFDNKDNLYLNQVLNDPKYNLNENNDYIRGLNL